ncbi:5-oxoprolinase [Colletotrichum shisoi]|uniref:5-oxoprolinase n=1 Tax=Colletotrichum shisoi TaxID=2078593 RepID=A0A5Q4BPZ5_9PEZI|nr:5-oxoprolinase [Colletotrichum shisoi]
MTFSSSCSPSTPATSPMHPSKRSEESPSLFGRVRPEFFPKIFGPNEDLPLDVDASRRLFEELTASINKDENTSLSVEEVAAGFLDVANESMCRPIRTLTEAKGYDAGLHNLASFGGAGGQHACDIAKTLGISRVLVHKYSSVLSAYGMALADVVSEESSPCALTYTEANLAVFAAELDRLVAKAGDVLLMQRIPLERIVSERYLNMRFQGSDTPLMIQESAAAQDGGYLAAFKDAHQKQFGFLPVGRDVIIDDYRVRAIGKTTMQLPTPWPKELASAEVYFKGLGWSETPVYGLATLSPRTRIAGPALIMDDKQTIVVIPDAAATVLSETVVVDVAVGTKETISTTTIDPIQLSIFGHRFMGVAEQAGRALQKTSVSTNIKERLDFSCTVFSPEGGLVANAPHFPAMIGSMAFAVKWQIDHWGEDLKPGDVTLSNAPVCGGTHLPDLTVITPVFDAEGKKIIFWTASRGHHADVGGILSSSMPPNSKELWEEGAIIKAFKVIEGGVFKEKELTDLLMAPSKFPGCSGTRCLRDNISDIKAQAAANHRGSQLIHGLIEDYGLDVVQFYMEEIQGAAERAVRDMLKTIHRRTAGEPLSAIDYMDDGTPIQLKVTIDPATGGAVFDFDGTGAEAYGNWNAPIAICNSSIIFALRCMADAEIPLNQGAIRPIDVRVPEASLLRPTEHAAVCAGNVLTSQRVVDVIFRAFGAAAASQGCMNNLTFGTDDPESGFGYYETICGGDGIVRDIEFGIPIKVSILSERRAFAPYGMAGGADGERGRNVWVKKGGRVVNLGGKNTAKMEAGDRIVIMSPGGGGYGRPEDRVEGGTRRPDGFVGAANGTVDMMQSMGESA